MQLRNKHSIRALTINVSFWQQTSILERQREIEYDMTMLDALFGGGFNATKLKPRKLQLDDCCGEPSLDCEVLFP